MKVFLDVTVERLGDGAAAFIILFYTLSLGGVDVKFLSYFSIALVLIWTAVVLVVQGGYMEALRRSLAYRDKFLDEARIDYADKETVEAILNILKGKEEQPILFALDLAEKLDPKVVVARLPRAFLRHSSVEVRRRILRLLSQYPDPNDLGEVRQVLESEKKQVQAEAINTVFAILKKDAFPLLFPFLDGCDPEAERSAIQCMLQSGDSEIRQEALISLRKMATNLSPDGEKARVEAARLMGEIDDPEFPGHLSRLIREDPSPEVICEAMAAAAARRYQGVVRDIILRLGGNATKLRAREALIQYGEFAVKGLRGALSDSRVSRGIRINIPRTLSKIRSQAAMNGLLSGLLEEDRSIRFQAILALEEMARRFPDLKVDREIIESAIISDVMLYSQRFAIFFVLFAGRPELWVDGPSLLRQTLMESMERVRERVVWLLSLIYPPKDIRGVWGALNSGDSTKQAYAVELLDNLLTGDVKRYIFPFYGDTLEPERFRLSLRFLGWASLNANTALRMLLDQADIWLTAATMWEIGVRGLTGFRDKIAKFLKSENHVLRETAELVIHRIRI